MRYITTNPKFYIDTQTNRIFLEFKIQKKGKDKYIRVILSPSMWQEKDKYTPDLEK